MMEDERDVCNQQTVLGHIPGHFLTGRLGKGGREGRSRHDTIGCRVAGYSTRAIILSLMGQ